MFSRFFIKRPIFATVIAILMVIVGLLAMTSLPISQFPDITPPTISVRASYPGANATTVAQTVGVPIEQQVNGVEGMMYMSSSSGSDGSYSLTITFENGTDIDIAAVNVQNRISQVQSQLPEPVIQEGVSVHKQATNMVLMCAFTGDKEHPYDALYLTNYCQLNIVDALSRVKGVGGVNAFGGGQYSMRIWLDPELMRARGISPQEVSAAIQSQNMEVSAGSVGQEPSNQGAQFEYTLVSNGRLITAEEFGDIIVRTDKTGILRLRDLGKVELGSTAYNTKTELNGKECALVGIQQLPGSNAVDVAKGVKEELAKLANYFPPGVHYEVVLDTTQFVDASIEEVLVTFVETSLIVLVVILLFLQQWRAVVIPMLTIPVSLIATFAVMKMLGFTINTLTLFGLVLAIAIVVDDAIVVVEDCARLVDKGILNRVQAAEKAMDELTGPVVGEVLVLLSVFIPTAFISGITGELYKQFALTIAISTAFSGFNALTFTPAMCALFLSPRKPSRFFIYRWFNSAYDFVLRIYKAVIHRLLHHPAVALGGFLILAVIAFYGYVKWPNSYIPAEDMGYFICSVQLPTGASLERTEQAMDRIQQDLCAEIPDIDNVMAISGMSFLGGGNASNYGSMFVTLKPWKERGKNTSFDIIAKAQEIAARVPEAIFFAVNPPAIPGLGMSSGLEMQLLDLKNEGPEQMMQAISMVKERADKDPRIASVTSMYQGTVPQYQLSFDRNRIEMLGLDLSDVYRTLSSYMGGSYVNDFVDFGRVFQVRMAGDAAARAQIDDILKLSVPNALGSMVPFATFTSVDQVMGQATADRYNMYATASLTANPAKGVSSSDGIKAMEEIVSETLGTNYAYAWTGQAYQETRSGTTVTAVFIFAIILTILFLAAQYESWTDPIAVVLSMPIAVLGVILGCLIMSQSISIYTQIGLILLLGLSAKNAILIVEYAVDFRRTGMSIPDSAEQAGVIRFRPIMMTALAFILGVMPMVFATGAGAESRISLGTAVVFGMAMNALFGTLLVPNFWELMQHVQEKYLSRVFKKESATMPPTNDPGDGNSGTAASV